MHDCSWRFDDVVVVVVDDDDDDDDDDDVVVAAAAVMVVAKKLSPKRSTDATINTGTFKSMLENAAEVLRKADLKSRLTHKVV